MTDHVVLPASKFGAIFVTYFCGDVNAGFDAFFAALTTNSVWMVPGTQIE